MVCGWPGLSTDRWFKGFRVGSALIFRLERLRLPVPGWRGWWGGMLTASALIDRHERHGVATRALPLLAWLPGGEGCREYRWRIART